MVKPLPIVGVCRFSFLGFSDWRSHTWKRGEKSDEAILAENRSTLFRPERLERRFSTFERLTLPSLEAQTDKDFVLIVLTSDELPIQYTERLKLLSERYPFMKVAFAPPGNVRTVTNNIYSEMGLKLSSMLQFRLDDDDAVGSTYIKRIRKLADGLHGMEPRRSFAVTFPSVLVAAAIEGSVKFYFRHMPHTAAGQAMYHPKRNVLDWAHHRVGRGVMYVSDYFDQWVLQTFLTGINDSGSITPAEIRRRGLEELPEEKLAAILAKHFPFISVEPEWWQSL